MRKFLRFLSSRMFITGILLLAELTGVILLWLYVSGFDRWIYLTLSAFSLPVMLHCISVKGNVAYKISWIFFIGIVPLIGSICYLLFAKKKFTRRQIKKMKPYNEAIKRIERDDTPLAEIPAQDQSIYKILNYIDKADNAPVFKNTDVTFFKVGDDAWPVMVEELKKAKHYIFMEYFIIEFGQMWGSILEILKQKVKEGVDVRIMYDDFGSITYLPTKYDEELRSYGIQCLCYNKFIPVLNIKMNNRDHRKILVIDGHTGFTGGINLGDEYVNIQHRFGHWKDNAVMLKGEGVFGLTTMFLSMWGGSHHIIEKYNDYSYDKYKDELGYKPKCPGYVQPFGDIPFNYEAVTHAAYINILMRAKSYVYITTPYLILSPELEFAICDAAKQGVNVVILTPAIPDKKMVFSVTRSYYDSLLEAGVKIYEYTPGFIHSKEMICDDEIAVIGTCNLDYRSLFLHFECGTVLYKVPCISEMKEDFLNSIEKSHCVDINVYKKKNNIFIRIWWSILRIFAPLL